MERPDPDAFPRPSRRATRLLLVSLEAAVVGTLAFLAAGTRDGDPDVVLVAVGWLATVVSGAAVVAFAFRAGIRDRVGDVRSRQPYGGREPAVDPVPFHPTQRSALDGSAEYGP